MSSLNASRKTYKALTCLEHQYGRSGLRLKI
ncbi:hypothetical protein GDO78_013498 [Eleutherodactylus coqui]|uniref:Uncharacterized protein n=1 Tax=Eleutherodactylus coqui TaxID=57060 RepID=A0A8J6F0V0_ELECQ|nr:hypothetical protein GDO78_013498 [Eleutherodactylus coqui]